MKNSDYWYKQLRHILKNIILGLSRPKKKYIPRISKLSNSSYENENIVYRAQPINQGDSSIR